MAASAATLGRPAATFESLPPPARTPKPVNGSQRATLCRKRAGARTGSRAQGSQRRNLRKQALRRSCSVVYLVIPDRATLASPLECYQSIATMISPIISVCRCGARRTSHGISIVFLLVTYQVAVLIGMWLCFANKSSHCYTPKVMVLAFDIVALVNKFFRASRIGFNILMGYITNGLPLVCISAQAQVLSSATVPSGKERSRDTAPQVRLSISRIGGSLTSGARQNAESL